MSSSIRKIAGLVCLALSAMALITGCSRQLDINRNPNDAVQANVDPYLVFPGAMSGTASNVSTGNSYLYRWLGFIATAAGTAPPAAEESYNLTTTYGTAAFTTPLDLNEDLQFMENKAKAKGQTFYVAAAKILKSLNFARVVDVYNSIPYSEALQGLNFITPKYDDPIAIYEDLIRQIDTGIAMIKTYDLALNPNLKVSDIMYGSEIPTALTTTDHKLAWIRFANTLKLRLLMHQAARPERQAYIQSEMSKIAAEGSGFMLSAKSASVNPGYSQALPSPYYATFGFTIAGQDAGTQTANNTLLNFLKVDSDPR
ncbi:MAG: SusD/RagB family nutrient-binding outer membrane lipoprotein, partial [Chitinophagaceae bacterium]